MFFSPSPLPLPTGPYKVGTYLSTIPVTPTITYALTNKTISSVLFRVYYPAHNEQVTTAKPTRPTWLPIPQSQYMTGICQFVGVPTWFAKIGSFLFRNNRIQAVTNAKPVDLECPVMVFSHGLGGMTSMYSTYCTAMASHGFIVYALEHRDGSAASTQLSEKKNDCLHYETYTNSTPNLAPKRHMQVAQRVKETELLVEHLKQRYHSKKTENIRSDNLDVDSKTPKETITSDGPVLKPNLSKIVIAGHSFGAATALAAVHKLPAGTFCNSIFLDIWTQPIEDSYRIDRLSIPHMSLISQQFHDWESNLADVRTVHRPTSSRSKVILVKESAHMQQSDFGLFWPRFMKKVLKVAANPVHVMQANIHASMEWLSNASIISYTPPDLPKEVLEMTTDLQFK